jgi:hypothetical protein
VGEGVLACFRKAQKRGQAAAEACFAVEAEDSLVGLLSFVSELDDFVSSVLLPLVLLEPFFA